MVSAVKTCGIPDTAGCTWDVDTTRGATQKSPMRSEAPSRVSEASSVQFDKPTCQSTYGEARGTDSEGRLLQGKKEELEPISCVAQAKIDVTTTSPTPYIPGESRRGSREMVMAEWAEEPLSQIDLTELKS